jgi:hypothetical protein
MYEKDYTRQALPQKNYRELLGSALCVFNANNDFVIETILRNDSINTCTWYELIDLPSGKLKSKIRETIAANSDGKIADLFDDIVDKRNRIIHSFQITDENNEQILRTKNKEGNQYNISEEFLLEFIKLNEELSSLLHSFRGY